MYEGSESLYSGRKIRGLGEKGNTLVEDTTKEEVGQNTREEGPGIEEVPIPVHRREETTRQSYRQELESHTQSTTSVRGNTPMEQLRSCIERASSGLIGVFGMNSDNVVNEALRQVQYNRFWDFYVIHPSRLIVDDVFTMFASSMLSFVEQASDYRDDWQREAYRIINEIGAGESDFDFYDYGLTKLSRVSQRLERPQKCRELIDFIKNQRSMHNAKFIWNIEIDIGRLDYMILSKLSQIASQDLIIIVSTLGTLDFEVGNIGAMVGHGNPNEAGYGVLHKYMGFQEIVRAD
jgi:hypothetical protein